MVAPQAPATSYNSTYVYDIAGNSWTTGPNMNVAHSFTAGTAIGNRLLILAGFNGSADTNTVEMTTLTCATVTPTATITQTPTPITPTATPTCNPNGAYNVLIVYADGLPTSLPPALAAEPGIASVTLFNGLTGTPTLAQLQQYQIVVPWSNNGWADQTTLGNNLGSYLAGGGIVVAFNFDWFGGTQASWAPG